MDENFFLLTKVSNSNAATWAYIAIQVSMWIAVISQIFLLFPDMIHVIKTKDTRENKWFKWIIWFVCSACWIAYSLFLLWENIPLEECIGLCISEGINLICLFIIYSIKISNIILAKKLGMSENQWCAMLNAVHIAKKTLSKKTRRKLKNSCKGLSAKEKAELYVDALREYNVGSYMRRKVRKAAKKVAKKVIKDAKKK